MKNFISIDLSDEDILPFLHSAIENKKKGLPHTRPLEGKNIILFFEKNSTRTRLSFELAIKQLGGTSTILNSKDTHFGSGKENLRDTIQTFETYSDGIVMRVNDHQTILDAVKFSRVPIINGLSNLSHPCQCMAGLMTLIEEKGSLKDLNIVWMGQITNVAHSWIDAYLSGLGFSLNIFCPNGGKEKWNDRQFEYIGECIYLEEEIIHTKIDDTILSNADVIMTDTWQSMGENTNNQDLEDLKDYRVTSSLMKKAKSDCIFLHCLPADRQQEVEAQVIDGPSSRVWQEAENRLHIQKQILIRCFS